MKKWLKVVLWIIGTPIVLILVFGITYIVRNQQGHIDSFQIGNQQAEYKILVAAQESEFKGKMVDRIIKEWECDSIYIRVLDCTDLNDEHYCGWDAYIIVHTMQVHKMPKETDLFLKNIPDLENVSLVSTSGAGDEHYKGLDVDGISTPSRESVIEQIMDWLKPRVEKQLNHSS